MRNQKTLRAPLELKGIGLHTGRETTVKVLPAGPDQGVIFVRTDLPDAPHIPATLDFLAQGARRTALKNGEAEVNTVEHLFAAFLGLGVDNAEIHIDGPELPGLDGSAIPFAEAIQKIGLVEQKSQRIQFIADKPLHVTEGDATVMLVPNEQDELRLSYTLDLPGSGYSAQFVEVALNAETFCRDIAPARTFVLRAEADQLRAAGLGQGANTENTLVIDDGKVLENVLRFPDEFARHKLLDLAGDLFLAGVDIRGRVLATRSGHGTNRALVRLVADEMKAREVAGQVGRDSGVDIREILQLLPHRYPFLLIDRVIELEGYRRAVGIKNVTINEPFFQGHFPSQPIMPGVLILEAMAQLAGVLLLRRLENTGKLAVLWSIDKVKLRRSVIPGDQLRIEIEATKVRDTIGQVQAWARVNDKTAAEAVLTFTLIDAA
ncbi:MAG: UDP-3-O-[3-hydroxymyristoyl] N-acetylglucosamine deacetylase [Planctomycetes bacterium]|nr:UDP-3-O-[3-hydroxymyristoyl] N-acetylglucosamine deacetylase [Planctomycetota bacterium]MCC7171527.1 UDP-3-O-[3-hydroxymyristoyl] N-acetylglucosamine deacetylase [Planctomycetota bacterium]